MDAVDVIRTKRDGGELTDEQIDWVIDAYTRGEVADEQMSRAGHGDPAQRHGPARDLALDRRDDRLRRADGLPTGVGGRPTADKHSTGGVGDKITLPLAPLVAACGAAVPQLSGRGLGPHRRHARQAGVDPRLAGHADPRRDARRSSRDVGAVICAAGDGLAPADKKLYALRDVTGTVEAIPLIASSIMSKKIAEGTGALVLDVKVGSGAFMKDVERARELARDDGRAGRRPRRAHRRPAHRHGRPLGLTAGNAPGGRASRSRCSRAAARPTSSS